MWKASASVEKVKIQMKHDDDDDWTNPDVQYLN